jgi:hypothetical protein
MTVILKDNRSEIADIVGRKYVTILRTVADPTSSIKANPKDVRSSIRILVATEIGKSVADELIEYGLTNALSDHDEYQLREETTNRRFEIAKGMIDRLMHAHFFRDLGLMLHKGGVRALAREYPPQQSSATGT